MDAVSVIFKRYPLVKKKIGKPNDPNISLTNPEAVFLQLVKFFNDPVTHQFSLNMLYDHLEDEELLFALEMIVRFFQKNTDLVQEVNQTFYDTHLLRDQIVGQKGFSDMVEKAIPGIKFKPSMIFMFWKRKSERIPRPDLIINGTPYWRDISIKEFIKKEKVFRNKK